MTPYRELGSRPYYPAEKPAVKHPMIGVETFASEYTSKGMHPTWLQITPTSKSKEKTVIVDANRLPIPDLVGGMKERQYTTITLGVMFAVMFLLYVVSR